MYHFHAPGGQFWVSLFGELSLKIDPPEHENGTSETLYRYYNGNIRKKGANTCNFLLLCFPRSIMVVGAIFRLNRSNLTCLLT